MQTVLGHAKHLVDAAVANLHGALAIVANDPRYTSTVVDKRLGAAVVAATDAADLIDGMIEAIG